MNLHLASAPQRLTKLLKTDTRNIIRDPTLLVVLIFSILPIVLFALFKDDMNQAALSTFGLDNISIYVAPIVLVLPAYLIGWVVGFLILEERDDGPIMALDVTPVGKRGIALYRAGLTFSLTFVIALIATRHLYSNISIILALSLSIFTAIQAAIVTFALPAIANNKVQGLAMTKVMNLFTMLPLLAIIASPWRYLAALFPSFWIGELLQLSPTSYLAFPLVLVFSLACHLLVLSFFYHRLIARTG